MEAWGFEVGQVTAQIAALFTAIRWIAGRISKIEEMVDRKLNNGTKSELTDIKVDIASIQAHIKYMPRRKDDPSYDQDTRRD